MRCWQIVASLGVVVAAPGCRFVGLDKTPKATVGFPEPPAVRVAFAGQPPATGPESPETAAARGTVAGVEALWLAQLGRVARVEQTEHIAHERKLAKRFRDECRPSERGDDRSLSILIQNSVSVGRGQRCANTDINWTRFAFNLSEDEPSEPLTRCVEYKPNGMIGASVGSAITVLRNRDCTVLFDDGVARQSNRKISADVRADAIASARAATWSLRLPIAALLRVEFRKGAAVDWIGSDRIRVHAPRYEPSPETVGFVIESRAPTPGGIRSSKGSPSLTKTGHDGEWLMLQVESDAPLDLKAGDVVAARHLASDWSVFPRVESGVERAGGQSAIPFGLGLSVDYHRRRSPAFLRVDVGTHTNGEVTRRTGSAGAGAQLTFGRISPYVLASVGFAQSVEAELDLESNGLTIAPAAGVEIEFAKSFAFAEIQTRYMRDTAWPDPTGPAASVLSVVASIGAGFKL